MTNRIHALIAATSLRSCACQEELPLLQAPLGITALAGQVRTLRGRPLAGVMLAVVEYSYNAASRLTSLLYRQETTVLGDLIYTLTRGQ